MQSGSGVELPVILVPPFYGSRWFWTIAGISTIAGVAGGVRYATRKRMQHQFEQSESRRAIEAERMRIAQDIHDDMGARLTQISLASGLALRNTPPESAAIADLKRLDRAAREMAIALDEIVWAVNPAHDTLEGLGNYISQYVTEITAESSTRCRLEIPALLMCGYQGWFNAERPLPLAGRCGREGDPRRTAASGRAAPALNSTNHKS